MSTQEHLATKADKQYDPSLTALARAMMPCHCWLQVAIK
jgi:hypothetical protein